MRPTECVISKSALRHNLRVIRDAAPETASILAIVKADAYGHGAGVIARVLEEEGVGRFGVATIDEARQLRQYGVRGSILLLGGSYGDDDLVAALHLTPVFSDADSLRRWAQARRVETDQNARPCHLKFDTGMGRLGFQSVETPLQILKEAPWVSVEGVMTHLAVADESSPEAIAYTEKQLARFSDFVFHMKAACPSLRFAHCANSALILRHAIPDGCRVLVRPGLSLYGVSPAPFLEAEHSVRLKPILTWQTAIHSIKTVEAGDTISYGRTFMAKRRSRIAVLPVGYADGYPRLASNRAYVLVRGKRVPVVGRVCMDLMMIDVTDCEGVLQGDPVILIGEEGDQMISVSEVAAWSDTISYEVLCRITARVRRRYV